MMAKVFMPRYTRAEFERVWSESEMERELAISADKLGSGQAFARRLTRRARVDAIREEADARFSALTAAGRVTDGEFRIRLQDQIDAADGFGMNIVGAQGNSWRATDGRGAKKGRPSPRVRSEEERKEDRRIKLMADERARRRGRS